MKLVLSVAVKERPLKVLKVNPDIVCRDTQLHRAVGVSLPAVVGVSGD